MQNYLWCPSDPRGKGTDDDDDDDEDDDDEDDETVWSFKVRGFGSHPHTLIQKQYTNREARPHAH